MYIYIYIYIHIYMKYTNFGTAICFYFWLQSFNAVIGIYSMCGIYGDYHQLFFFNAFGFLNDNLTQTISVKKSKVHLDKHNIYLYLHTYIVHIITKHDKLCQTIKSYKSCSTEQAVLISAVKNIFFWCGEKVHMG